MLPTLPRLEQLQGHQWGGVCNDSALYVPVSGSRGFSKVYNLVKDLVRYVKKWL